MYWCLWLIYTVWLVVMNGRERHDTNVLVSLVNIYGVIGCNEWKTEKCHECTNVGKVKRLELWWQLYCTSLPERDVWNIRPLDFCWTECTKDSDCECLHEYVRTLCNDSVRNCTGRHHTGLFLWDICFVHMWAPSATRWVSHFATAIRRLLSCGCVKDTAH